MGMPKTLERMGKRSEYGVLYGQNVTQAEQQLKQGEQQAYE
jgi:hypothetical protein